MPSDKTKTHFEVKSDGPQVYFGGFVSLVTVPIGFQFVRVHQGNIRSNVFQC